MGLFDSIKGKMAENKEKTERAYEEAMNYNQELNFAFEYAVRKAVETSDHARKNGYLLAAKKMSNSGELSDVVLEKAYDRYAMKCIELAMLLRSILMHRGLMEKDEAGRYIRKW